MLSDQSIDIVGVVPAAGVATRLGLHGYSKEILPIGYRSSNDGKLVPELVIHGLFRKMNYAGITNIYIVTRQDKWDIPRILGDGSQMALNLSYCIMNQSPGVPFSVARAIPYCKSSYVAIGFPDIIMEPDTIYEDLRNHISTSEYDMVLAVFPAEDPSRVDMVSMENSSIRYIDVKPGKTSLKYAWAAAIWSPRFSEFLSDYIRGEQIKAAVTKEADSEIHLGDVFNMALKTGFRAGYVKYSNPFVDTGTVESFLRLYNTNQT